VRAAGYAASSTRAVEPDLATTAPVARAEPAPAGEPRGVGLWARRLLRAGHAGQRARRLRAGDGGPRGGRWRAGDRDPRGGWRAGDRGSRRAGGAAAQGPPGELSGLRLLLDQLDALLRDPTLTLALRAFARRISTGARELAAAAVAALRRLPRLRLPRRLLLGLLALALPLALLALLSSGRDDRVAPRAPPRAAAQAGGASLAAAAMPALQAAPDAPPAANVALVVGGGYGYGGAALRRELRALGAWIAANHAAGTRVSVIDASTGRASAALGAAALARVRLTGPRRTTTAAIRSALAGGHGRRLLVTVGSVAPRSAASTLSIATRRGAGAPATVALRRGSRAHATIDDRRPDALAATVARALIAISGQRERR
jgi:hypothetical protein